MDFEFLSAMFQFIPCGLVFDATGVLLLGGAFFLKTFDTAYNESSMCWDSNPVLFTQITKSKADGISGTSLLFIGFVYQFFGYLNVSFLDCYETIIVSSSYMLLIVFLCGYFAWLRKKFVDTWFMRAKEKVEGDSKQTS